MCNLLFIEECDDYQLGLNSANQGVTETQSFKGFLCDSVSQWFVFSDQVFCQVKFPAFEAALQVISPRAHR